MNISVHLHFGVQLQNLCLVCCDILGHEMKFWRCLRTCFKIPSIQFQTQSIFSLLCLYLLYMPMSYSAFVTCACISVVRKVIGCHKINITFKKLSWNGGHVIEHFHFIITSEIKHKILTENGYDARYFRYFLYVTYRYKVALDRSIWRKNY